MGLDRVCPDRVRPDPVCPDPVCPDPVCLDPVYLDPACLDLVCLDAKHHKLHFAYCKCVQRLFSRWFICNFRSFGGGFRDLYFDSFELLFGQFSVNFPVQISVHNLYFCWFKAL